MMMNKPHHFTGIFAGDYFIHRFILDGNQLFAYGYLRQIDRDGQYHIDYQSQQPPSKPLTLDADAHQIIGRISRKAYLLAKMRHWPNDAVGVAIIIDYSASKPTALSFGEWLRLLFTR